MAGIFFELTFILCLAAVLSIFFRLLKQPAILAYILTGIIIGPFGQLQLGSGEFIRVMGEFGITLLLFMLGLEMKFREFRLIGKTALIVGAIQIILSLIFGFWLSQALGFSSLLSFYISLALTFSSTVIVIKMLSDKKDLKSLYGKISIGLLLIQDFFAILILVLLSGLKTTLNFSQIIDLPSLAFVVVKGFALFSIVILFSHTILPKFIDKIAKSEETLFLFSLSWVFGLAAIVSSKPIGFSIEIGGFLAGIALADVSENFQIIARMKALRDFFMTIFFVFLGMSMAFGSLGSILIPIIVFSTFVIIVKPLIIMAAMGFSGYKKRTSFLTAATLAQISEFSLIIIFLGNKLGHVSSDIVSIVTAVAIATFVVSTYVNLNTHSLYRILSGQLVLFERKGAKKEDLGVGNEELANLKQHVVLVGANRMGENILDALKDLGEKLIVVDFDPDIVNTLKGKNITSIFGDIADLEIQERAGLHKAKLVISTVPDLEDNLLLIKGLNRKNRRAKIIVMAQDREDAKALYKAGADYVVLPYLSGGRHLAKMLKEDRLDEIDSFKSKDLNYLS